MDTEILHIFIDVVHAGSFANAAKKRNQDPSSISRAIAALETQLDARLFHRTTRSITLTDAGRIYLARVAPICDELARAEDEIRSAQQQIKGRIRFSTSVAFGQTWIVPLLPELRQQYPDLEIDMNLSDRNLDIIDERLDFAIRLNKVSDNRFIRSRLKDTKYRVCASPDYIKNNSRIGSPEQLSDHQLIVFDLPNYKDKWRFKCGRKKIKVIDVYGQITLSNALAIRDCTLQGLGISLLADWLVDNDIASGKLINLFPEHEVSAEDFDSGIWVIYPERAFLPTKTRVTIDFIRAKLAQKYDDRQPSKRYPIE
ncbi:MAG: LysR family transcriptional regulator [Pseudomonadales bacterium]|uniref:LysR family transcriptional regulator n=1 Tax=unclassified Ketobacter TaxID=2639109 RepID=UPI000C3C0283|nr:MULTISPECIES: LysR family transcriptional regulator [unclassified Ketobacter]MAQ23347.1 LysR family transcriptional regulator [Pseudomonadales bacterium]MBI27569.1 LysR family transcriptional regulator [Pseudomonadales bacterium]RLT90600.1 MAG: LysR family transcriptional regulator [Ketobacter sp. GenoA1]RLT99698.1 MAG: LysR family transcriptional regulator [Ketobacter sp.]|tara:strand:+ start:29207 stop:30145 length:939 start_codon:yes stop_codon:yes gene_type:complete